MNNQNDDQNNTNHSQFEISHVANIIEKLIHLSRFGNLLTLVTGNNGSGKTTVLEDFLSVLDDNCQVCHINAQPLLSIDQLFQRVIESFAGESTFTGIPLTAKQYEEWAEQLPVISGNRLVVIDDGETLSNSVLQELCKLSAMQQSKETPHLHIILFGNYDLNVSLEHAAQGILTDEGIYVIDIPTLTEEESSQWLEFLLSEAEMNDVTDPEVLSEILEEGQGNLAHIKKEATELMSYNQEIEQFKDELPRWKISVIGYWFATLTIVILFVLGLLLFQDELIRLTGFGDSKQEVAQTVLNTSKNDSQQKDNLLPSEDSVSTSVEEESITEMLLNEASETQMPVSQETVFEVPNDEESNVELSMEEEPIDVDEEIEQPLTQEPEIIAEGIETSVTEPAEDDNPVVSEIQQQPSPGYTFSDDEQFLLIQPDSNYVIQLLGLSNEQSVKLFINDNHLSEARYYRSYLNSKPWFIIVTGNFDTIKDASVARAQLSELLLKNEPWVKQLKIIKKEIHSAKEKAVEVNL